MDNKKSYVSLKDINNNVCILNENFCFFGKEKGKRIFLIGLKHKMWNLKLKNWKNIGIISKTVYFPMFPAAYGEKSFYLKNF